MIISINMRIYNSPESVNEGSTALHFGLRTLLVSDFEVSEILVETFPKTNHFRSHHIHMNTLSNPI